jgi:hypothetical protein
MIQPQERFMSSQQNNPRLGIPTVDEGPPGDRAEIDRATKKRALRPDELEPGEHLNPPRTTSGWLTSPKFGSAGSGGAEIEPGSEKD